MKRHVQTTGIRQWAGEDLIELQSEPLKAIDSFFAEYGSCVIKGCTLTDNGDGTFRMSPGLVALEGKDVDEEPTFKIVPFEGVDEIKLPAYLTLSHSVINRAYVDEKLKQIAYNYYAEASSVKPEDTPYLELSEEHFPRFVDVIQDPEHRFFTDDERQMLNDHDADIQRIDEKDAEQDGRLDNHDSAIKRIDAKDVEQDGRLNGHDLAIERIDEKDEEQDGRLKDHDTAIDRIDAKDAQQDSRLSTHDLAIERIDKKDTEQDGRLSSHDSAIKRIDEKDEEQDGRLDGHDSSIERIDKKDVQQDGRLDDHDLAIKWIDTKDVQQDGRLNNHDSAIERIDKKDEDQDGRLKGHDEDIQRIDQTDSEQDDKIENNSQRFAEHIKEEIKDSLKLYKVAADKAGHIKNVEVVVKKDITDLGIPAQDTTYALATTTTNGLMSSTDKNKLDGVATNANNYAHPTYTARTAALNKVTVDATGHVSNVTAVTKADITGLGIPAQDTTYTVATTTANGLMSSTDKNKLDGVATNANNYAHPTYTARAAGLNKVTVDATGHVSNVAAVTKADITGLGIPAQDTTYNVATPSTNGLMSSADKTKLDGVATNANNYTHPAYTSRTAALNKVTVDTTGHVSGVTAVTKADITSLGIPAQDTTYGVATTSANGLMSSADKTKLNGVATNANNYTHPSYTARTAALNKVTVDATGHVSNVAAVTKADITALGIPAQDTTYSVATTSANGLMSSADKTKLNGVATNANNYTHPAYTARAAGLNKVTVDATGHINNVTAVTKADITALGIPAQDTTYGLATTSANGLMSSSDKTKLNGVAAGAQKNIAPIHKTATLAVASWGTSGSYKAYTISDANVVDGCYVAIVIENASADTAADAEIMPKPDLSVGKIVILAKNTPTASINITYTIIQ